MKLLYLFVEDLFSKVDGFNRQKETLFEAIFKDKTEGSGHKMFNEIRKERINYLDAFDVQTVE